MVATLRPEAPLNSGAAIPLVGFGTAAFPFEPDSVKDAVVKAIDLGYRHFDTATLYQSEKPLGEAIEKAIDLGLIKSRQELFITSKLWCSDAHPHLVLPALQTTLRNLGLEYLDLYLIHWPMSSKPGEYKLLIEKENMMSFDLGGVWKAMEECTELGLARSIGVSNFSCKKLQDILDMAVIPPAVNQICLRWAYEQGVSVLVKSFNQGRMEQNLELFDWILSDEQNLQIQKIPQVKGT